MDIRGNMIIQECEVDGRINISMIMAMDKGQGTVGNYINYLKKQNKPIVFVGVESDILVGMLKRRGFENTKEIMEVHDLSANKLVTTEVDVWIYESNNV